jgi:hypothetical protein
MVIPPLSADLSISQASADGAVIAAVAIASAKAVVTRMVETSIVAVIGPGRAPGARLRHRRA